MQQNPNYLKEKTRKLFFGDMNGNQLMGLLGGAGGLYAINKGSNDYQETVDNLQ